MAVSVRLAEISKSIEGVQQWPYRGVAEALEVIPRTLISNCGASPIRVLTQLRAKHAQKDYTWGIDGDSGKIVDMKEYGVWEPEAVKLQSIKTAIEVRASYTNPNLCMGQGGLISTSSLPAFSCVLTKYAVQKEQSKVVVVVVPEVRTNRKHYWRIELYSAHWDNRCQNLPTPGCLVGISINKQVSLGMIVILVSYIMNQSTSAIQL